MIPRNIFETQKVFQNLQTLKKQVKHLQAYTSTLQPSGKAVALMKHTSVQFGHFPFQMPLD